jgi:outer membrane protein assembly factor BamE
MRPSIPGNTTDLRMKKLLIIMTCIASLSITACSKYHLVHKIDVQQGNVITQDEVNQLEPGMNRRQVQYIMGSPMIADVFHQDRWDYVYLFEPGYGDTIEERVTLFFENDELSRVSGTLHPQAADAAEPRPQQVTLVVPPEERIEPGIFNKLWHWMTFRKADEYSYVSSQDPGYSRTNKSSQDSGSNQ